MDVMIIATKECTHRLNLEKELECLHIPYRVCFAEECPDLRFVLATRVIVRAVAVQAGTEAFRGRR